MALKNCKECGKEISTKASACPSCGAKQPKTTGFLAWISALILVPVLLLTIYNIYNDTFDQDKPVKTVAISKPILDKSPETQAQRLYLINSLIDRGIFDRVELPGSLPHLWVKPGFYSLDFDAKKDFVSVVYAYYYAKDRSMNIVALYDNKNGKKIGRYSIADAGLVLD